jgi:hypothetical protein
VTVNDNEAPTITCPADDTVDNDAGQCSAVVSYSAATGTDNCAIATVGLTNGIASGDPFPVTTTTNTFTATDVNGNTGKQTLVFAALILFGVFDVCGWRCCGA